jgi:hypothetical protein
MRVHREIGRYVYRKKKEVSSQGGGGDHRDYVDREGRRSGEIAFTRRIVLIFP